MIEWIKIDSPKIRKIAYNPEVNIMYIDFQGSIIDTPYTGLSEEKFKTFSKADDIDAYFEINIKNIYEKVELDIDNTINCSGFTSLP